MRNNSLNYSLVGIEIEIMALSAYRALKGFLYVNVVLTFELVCYCVASFDVIYDDSLLFVVVSLYFGDF